MPRVKRGKSHLKHRKNILKRVKGFRGKRKRLIKLAKVAGTRAGVFAYRDRRLKKREFRKLWTIRIKAAVRPLGLSYSRFIHALAVKKIALNRKMLSELAVKYPAVFAKLTEAIRTQQ